MADVDQPRPANKQRAALTSALGILAVLFVGLYAASAVWFGPPGLRRPSLVEDVITVVAWTIVVVGLVQITRPGRAPGLRHRGAAFLGGGLVLMAAGSVARWAAGWPQVVAVVLLVGVTAGLGVMLVQRGRWAGRDR